MIQGSTLYRNTLKTNVRFLVALLFAIPAGLMAFISHPQYGGVSSFYSALPMIIIFSVAYISATTFLSGRPFSLSENHISIAVTTFIVVNLLSIATVFTFRIPYSLSYLLAFFTVTTLWALMCEILLAPNSLNIRYALVKHGDWKIAYSRLLNIVLIDANNDSDQLSPGRDYDVLIIDYHTITNNPILENQLIAHTVKRVPIVDVSEIYEFVTGKLSLMHVSKNSLESLRRPLSSILIKRMLDIVLSGIALLFLTLPMLIILIAIVVESRGNPIYRQYRVGLNSQSFLLYKLRTMRANAEDRGPRFSASGDPRITFVGQLLRKFRVDEWPQFWNVLKGDMSIVGPRPERPEWVNIYREEINYYDLRHTIKPGITGWAQVMQGYTSTNIETKEKLCFDLYYIKNFNLYLDIKILLKTLFVLTLAKGAK